MQCSEGNMATLVRSQLNPLADTFVPSNLFYHRRVIELQAEKEYGSKTVQQSEKKHSNDRNTHYKIFQDIIDVKKNMSYNNSGMYQNYSLLERHLSCNLPILKCSKDSKLPVQKSNEYQNICFSEKSYPIKVECSMDLKESALKLNKDMCLIQNSYLTELECSTDDQKLVQKSLNQELRKNSHLPSRKRPLDISKGLEKESSTGMTPKRKMKVCTCPRMFGWIVPPDFTGNPFNFKYECGKKYPHSPDTNRWTLDQYPTKVKDIVTEVDTIAVNSTPISEFGEGHKGCFEVSDTVFYDAESNKNKRKKRKCIQSDTAIGFPDMEIDYGGSTEREMNKMKGFDLRSTSQTNMKFYSAAVPELIDDGIHPLLQTKLVNEEDEKILVEKAEKILERNLSHQSLDTSPELDCSEVPCTPWCNHVPLPVKQTYNKYHRQKAENAKKSEFYRRPQFASNRPALGRSLSADDAPLYDCLRETSPIDSRDMILLRMKYPLLYLKVQSSNKRKHESCDLTELRLDYSNAKSSMWGKFDSEDSLWQPLPDCKPENAVNQLNLYQKGCDNDRSVKRQRTMS